MGTDGSSYGLGLSNGWSDERRRLASAELTYDPATFRHLETIGIAAGMRCLEVGGGGGSVTRFMAERVGPTGSVVVTDLDTSLLEGCDRPNIEVRVHDICTDPLDGEFDIIHARLVLENVPDRLTVLKKLVAALRPGGWILIEDFDNSALMHVPVAQQFFVPARLGRITRRASIAAQALGASAGIDMQFGRDLPLHLVNAGLQEVDAESCSRLVHGGSPRAVYPILGLRRVGPTLVAAGRLSQHELDDAIETLEGPGSMTQSMSMVSAWGRSPASPAEHTS